MIPTRVLSFLGAFGLAGGLAGCAPSLSNRTYFPESPDSGDILATNPCSVRREPEIVVHGSEEERAAAAKSDPNFSTFFGGKTDAEIQKAAREAADSGLARLRKANPVFLCGLERVEFLGNEDYAKGVPESPTSFGLSPSNRIFGKISARRSARETGSSSLRISPTERRSACSFTT
ncbi:MAG TPA: hypothetical protein VFX30_07340 [bacterium]|nr:hypothetical protein [bacterium]